MTQTPQQFAGVAGHPVEDVKISDVYFHSMGGGSAELARRRPPEADKTAMERWAKNLQAALNAAGRAAESCERQSQPVLPPERRSALETCIARVSAKSEEVSRRYSRRTLSREEQAKQRAEQQDLHDQRIACDLASKR